MSSTKEILYAAFEKHQQPAFELICWDGSRKLIGAGPSVASIEFKTEASVIKLLQMPDLGLGDGYTDQQLMIDGELPVVLASILWPMMSGLTMTDSDQRSIAALRELRRNTPQNAKININHHYDLGNGFYRLWLDKNLTYSCAYFREETLSLDEAQEAKVDLVCKKLHLNAADRMLDIGCGWGHLMFHAAERYGAKVHGITLSEQQAAYIESEISSRNLRECCRVSLIDYRALVGSYTKISSVGMLEHVGKEFIPGYFESVAGLLADGGLTLLHTIGVAAARPIDAWFDQNIFPGYYVPCPSEIHAAAEKQNLSILDTENLRRHYARTVGLWRESFERALPEVRRLGFDDKFIRMWRFYLAATQAAFHFGGHHLYQFVFAKGTRNDLPMTRTHLYR